MAGNYPNAPSWRMPWDRDGSVLLTIDNANVVTQRPQTDAQKLNNESSDSVTTIPYAANGSMVVVFPELRDIDGFYLANNANSQAVDVYVSPNSTNGVDGTWTKIKSYPTGVTRPPAPGYRDAIESTTQLAMRAIKVTINGQSAVSTGDFNSFHLYGEVAPNENPSRLAIWHPTLDQRVGPAYFDWGNVPRSSSADLPFRVKNLSPSQTAKAIRVAMESLTDTTPSVVGQHSLSLDGSSFLAQVNVGDLAPGAISGTVTLRRITPSNAVFGLWTHRVFAEANSWA